MRPINNLRPGRNMKDEEGRKKVGDGDGDGDGDEKEDEEERG